MRLLIVSPYYSDHGGGVELVAGEIAHRLLDHGFEIVWAATGRPPSDLPPEIRTVPIPAWNWTERKYGIPYPLCSPFATGELQDELKACDVVHIHESLYMLSASAALLAKRYRKPLILTQHIGEIPYTSRLVRTMLAIGNRTVVKHVLKTADSVVFISATVQAYYNEFVRLKAPSRLIPNGLDTTLFSPVPEAERSELRKQLGWPTDVPHLLFVGRFVEKKGLPILRQLAEVDAGYRWIFVGHGPLDPQLWRLPNVHSVGRLNHQSLRDYYRAADLFILPSVGEGFPLVVQEAMACGLPVITTPETASGLPNVKDLVHCAAPQFDAMSSKMQEVLRLGRPSEAYRTALSQFATRSWDWETCASQYMDAITAAARSARRCSG